MRTSTALLYKRAELLEDEASPIASLEHSRRNPRRRSISPFRPSSPSKASKQTVPSAQIASSSSSAAAMAQGVSFTESMERIVNDINKSTVSRKYEQALNEGENVVEGGEEENLRLDQHARQKAFSTFLRKKSETVSEASASKTAPAPPPPSKGKAELAHVDKNITHRHKSPFRLRNTKPPEACIDQGAESLAESTSKPISSAISEEGKTKSVSPQKAFSMFTLKQGNKKPEESAMTGAPSVSIVNPPELPQTGMVSTLRHKSPFRSRNTKLSRATVGQDEEEASTLLNTQPESSAIANNSGHLQEDEALKSQPAQKAFSLFSLRQVIRKSEAILEASSALPVTSSELPHIEKTTRHKSPFVSRKAKTTITEENPVVHTRAVAERTELQENCKTSRISPIAISNASITAEETTKIEKKKTSRSMTRKTRSEIPSEMFSVALDEEQRENKQKIHMSSQIHSQPKQSAPVDSCVENILPQNHHGSVRRSHQCTVPLSSRAEGSNVETSPLPCRRTSKESEASPSASKTPSTAASPSTLRKASVEARTRESSEWLRLMGDIIMWRHIPRSAFLFGFGFFVSMGASRMQTVELSVVSMIAYAALAYLAVTYIKSIFLKGGAPTPAHILTEGDALRLVRLFLPPLNSILLKMGEIFSGEPTVTLKVAGALWLLAQFGSKLNVWTFIRIVYFALFTLPKGYSSYNEHIERQNRFLLAWAKAKWKACAYKKAVLVVAVIVAWNLSSMSTRICGVFFMIVAIKAYWNVLRESGLLQGVLNHHNFPNRMTSSTAP